MRKEHPGRELPLNYLFKCKSWLSNFEKKKDLEHVNLDLCCTKNVKETTNKIDSKTLVP